MTEEDINQSSDSEVTEAQEVSEKTPEQSSEATIAEDVNEETEESKPEEQESS
jgi:hypothetical protein